MIKIISLEGLIVGLVAWLMPPCLSAREMRPHFAVVLDQSVLCGPSYCQLWSGLRASMDLTCFRGGAYEESPKRHLKEKYRDKPIGVIVTIDKAKVEHALHLYAEPWPATPVVFAMLDIPPAVSAAKPIFNWPQMQGWNVTEASPPEDSEVRFRDPTLMEKYRWQSLAIAAALLVQAGLIMFLLHERHMRRDAEVESQRRMTELAHVNRQTTTGELSSSIAHELNQPLGSILTNAETAELILKSDNPDLGEIREILADIKRDDQRAGEVIRRLRAFLKRTPFETREVDFNEVMNEAFKFMSVQASARNVALYLQTAPGPLRIKGDPIQLQQVVLNLVVNSMDAMAAIPYGRTVIGRTELNGGSTVEISISDSGPGIPPGKLTQVFDPFYTTKDQGMGIGLSIARTIILAHKGNIWAENQNGGGAAFRFTLPLAT